MERIKISIRPLSFILMLSILLMVVLFFVQSRSDKSIRSMQKGNELAVKTFQINNALQVIINHVYFLESETRKQINTGKLGLSKSITDSSASLKLLILEVNKLTQDGKAKNNFADLNRLLQEKINTTVDILQNSKSTIIAKEKLTNPANKNLIDSIYITASDIQIIYENELQKTILDNSTISNQVLLISRALTLFALITILLSSTLIIRHLVKNNQLIIALGKAKEKADIAGSIKEQFLANMSHEIRTPLNSIIGFSNLAAETQLNPDQKEYISFINHSSKNLLYIINDILDFSKLEAGKLLISKAPFNLKDISHFIEMLFQVQITEKKVHFSCQLEEGMPLNLTGDDDRLKQILTNLVSNAIKFTSVGGNISLKISMIKKEDETAYIQFSVKDTGIGIPEEKLKTIFERFEQADSATTRKYGGTGLGLSIVKQLITLQNGTIFVKSAINAGSEFIAVIPYSINQLATQESATKGKITVVKNFNTHAKLLIAEDNKMNQILLKYLFKNWGFSITLSKDGNETIQLLSNNEYDLVLLDIQMPIIDGYGVAKWIRETKKSTVPIIAMTAHTMPAEIQKCKDAGMNDYLSKPLDESKVIALFNQYIPKNAAMKSPENQQFVDLENLQRIFGDENEIIIDFLNQFNQHYPSETKQLNDACENRNMEQVYTLAHNLKTTFTTLSPQSPLINPLKIIEKYKNIDPDWVTIKIQIDSINEATDLIDEAIKKIQTDLANK
ncbi:MAG: ATP-binding protein [Sphingobacteriia bacterium]